MSVILYKEALGLEESNPQKALEIYKQLEDENSEFHPRILLAGCILPVLVYIISFTIAAFIGIHRTITTVLILSTHSQHIAAFPTSSETNIIMPEHVP